MHFKGTTAYGLHFYKNSSLNLYGFCDADWGGCSYTRRSTTGFCIFLRPNFISWTSKKQSTVARSSSEAEYRAMISATVEITWISFILRDLDIPLQKPPQLFCDNLSALYMSVNSVFHSRTKHIEMNYHFVREKVVVGSVITRYIPSPLQVADILTKPLSKTPFKALRSKLGVHAHAHSNSRKDEKEDNITLPTLATSQ